MKIIGIGEYAVTNNDSEIIVTHALGSCVALIVHCPDKNVAAMAHIVLPHVKHHHKELSEIRPAYFADVIVPKMMEYFITQKGCLTNELKVYMVGGADSHSEGDMFHVGRRNVKAIKKLLNKYGVKPLCSQTGGHVSRTVYFDLINDELRIKQQNMIL